MKNQIRTVIAGKSYRVKWLTKDGIQEVTLLNKLYRSQVEARLIAQGVLLSSICFVVPVNSVEALNLKSS